MHSSQSSTLTLKTEEPKTPYPSLGEAKFHASKIGLPPAEAEKFWHYYEANGWKVGKNPMRKWHSAMAHWHLVWVERCRKQEWPKDLNEVPVFARIHSLEAVLASLDAEIKRATAVMPDRNFYPKENAAAVERRAALIQERNSVKARLLSLHRQQGGVA